MKPNAHSKRSFYPIILMIVYFIYIALNIKYEDVPGSIIFPAHTLPIAIFYVSPTAGFFIIWAATIGLSVALYDIFRIVQTRHFPNNKKPFYTIIISVMTIIALIITSLGMYHVEIAKSTGIYQLCELSEWPESDECYYETAYNSNNEQICNNILHDLLYTRNGCFQQLALKKNDTRICDNIPNETSFSDITSRSCYLNVISQTRILPHRI